MKELIKQWEKLNRKSNKILNEHKSFKNYNGIRIQMDKIEKELLDKYNMTVTELIFLLMV